MAARLNAPVFGAQDQPFADGEKWQATLGWRYQKSDRHFRGSEEEPNRQAEGSEVINHLNLLDIGISYSINPRWTVTGSIPYLHATRSYGIRDENREVIGRTEMRADGLGDIIIGARRWMMDPATHANTNVQLGFGVKLPTGQPDTQDYRTRYNDGVFDTTLDTNDQSIQPGDDGLGGVIDLQWFHRLSGGKCAFYFSGLYLFNPKATNGVETGRRRESEAIMSVADSYLARAGASFPIPKTRASSISIGARIEGVTAYDLFGSSEGFRRPGYAVSIEPAFNIAIGSTILQIAVPVAVYRNRVISYSDKIDGRHGDAAFADWLLIVNYSWYFGGGSKSGISASKAPEAHATPCSEGSGAN